MMNKFRCLFSHSEWTCQKEAHATVWVRGWITLADKAYDAPAMARILAEHLVTKGQCTAERLAEWMQEWRGNYAICIECQDKVLLATDIIRSIPLVYAQTSDAFLVSDSFEWMRTAADNPPLDIDCCEEYLVSGFVYGPNTLCSGINGVQAGEIIDYDGNTTKSHRYFVFNPDACQNPDLKPCPETYQQLDNLLLQSIKRMLASAPGVSRWVIPLSGGYDSRIIVSYLKRLGVENVLCFSYGRAGNEESAISQKVAAALGYEWHFVNYDRSGWNQLVSDEAMRNELLGMSNGTGLPMLHYLLQLQRMKERGLLEPNDAFVPGHTFDFIRGKQLNSDAMRLGGTDLETVAGLISRRHASFWPDKGSDRRIRERVRDLLDGESEDNCGRNAATIMEWFNWQERQAKFIVNSVRGYDAFGYHWRLPLWDRDLTQWWMSVPVEHRLDQKLFLAAYADKLGLPLLWDIPLFGAQGACSPTQPEFSLSKLGLSAARLVKQLPPVGALHRIWRGYFPPQTIETSWTFEDYFHGQAGTIGELLDLGRSAAARWPSNLRHHFRWREGWPVRQSGSMSTALLTAYVLKRTLLRSENRP